MIPGNCMSQITERQVKLVSIVSSLDKKSIPMTILQKIVFLCEDQIKACDMHYTFIKTYFGPFSKEIVSDVDELASKGIFELHNGNNIVVKTEIQDKWANAEKTVSELTKQFPDDYLIIKSALTSNSVISKAVGESITTSKH
jgi:uncharacterized protein YwgA